MPDPTNTPSGERAAEALLTAVGTLSRRVRQLPVGSGLTIPERAALGRLRRGGPATSAELARQEQISPQSMGATLARLEARGLITRSQDPKDGRRAVMSVTEAGLDLLRSRRNERVQQLAGVLDRDFTPAELEQLLAAAPLLERLGRSI